MSLGEPGSQGLDRVGSESLGRPGSQGLDVVGSESLGKPGSENHLAKSGAEGLNEAGVESLDERVVTVALFPPPSKCHRCLPHLLLLHQFLRISWSSLHNGCVAWPLFH